MSEIPIGDQNLPKRGDRVMAKDIAELWQAVKRLAARSDYSPNPTFPKSTKPPFTLTIRPVDGTPNAIEVFSEYGHVIPRGNASGDTGAPIVPTAIPTKASPLAVAEGDKIWVKLTIGVDGKATAAVWESGSAWVSDDPPELEGGDEAGVAGTRRVRIAEIIEDPDFTHRTKVKQLHTGHIEHIQPELIENLTTSPGTGEARIMQKFNPTAGEWKLRYLESSAAAYGVLIDEDTSKIGFDTKGGNLNLTIESAYIAISGNELDGYTYAKTSATEEVLYWRKGLYCGTTEPSESVVGTLDEKTVSFIADPP